MNNIRTIPFNREHLDVMVPRQYEAEKVIPYLQTSWFDILESTLHNYTVIKNGQIITCLGGILLWDGVWEIWQIPSIFVKDHRREYCRIVQGLIEGFVQRVNARRIQTHSPSDTTHDRWMTFLGFECEGVLREYSQFKEDFKLWARRYNHGV